MADNHLSETTLLFITETSLIRPSEKAPERRSCMQLLGGERNGRNTSRTGPDGYCEV